MTHIDQDAQTKDLQIKMYIKKYTLPRMLILIKWFKIQKKNNEYIKNRKFFYTFKNFLIYASRTAFSGVIISK